MRRILQLLTVAVVMAAMMATSGTSASAQSPCPPTGPSNGLATLLTPDMPRWAGFVCLDEVNQRFFCPPGFQHWLFRNPPGSRPPFQGECVELASSSNGGDGGAEPTQSSEQAESAPAESAPAESPPAESTPAESTPATTAGSIGDSVLEAYNNLKVQRRLLGVGILALALIAAILLTILTAWRLPMKRNVEDPQAWGIPQQQHYENYAPAEAPRQAPPETARGPEGEPNGAASSSPEGERLRRIRHLRRISQGRSPSGWRGG